MRITTWNCYRGEPSDRAGALAQLAPDLLALQECGRPSRERSGLLWTGESARQGLALVANGGVEMELGPLSEEAPRALPAYVHGPAGFQVQVLVLWTHRRPSYPLDARRTLDAYRGFIEAAPTILLGDFNASPVFDPKNRRFSDTDLIHFIREELGMVSAYHAFTGEKPGQETRPTLYWQFKREQPFHIDYCYLPMAWTERIVSVEVAGFEAVEGDSDHRPLSVDLSL